ncbi:MAG TPA: hypothetical protein VMF30_01805, partial [Pirellulales bacterium]|nr:hypothetical protein [Pirellulales bacterium]
DQQNANIATTLQNGFAAASPGQQMAQTALINLLQPLMAEQMMLTTQMRRLNEELQTTIGRRDAILDKQEKTTGDLQAQAANLKHEEQRLERAEQTEVKKIAVERQKTPPTKQVSFASFESFPFETERQRVLATAGQ